MLTTNNDPKISYKKRLKTRYDYSQLPDYPRQQLIEGSFVEEPSATYFHQRSVGNLYHRIRNHLERHAHGEVFISPLDTYISEINVFQPDVFFIRKKNLNRVEKHGIEGFPDLVMEVLSPSTAKYDLGKKRAAYARAGVVEYWIIDTDLRTVSVYHLQENATAPRHTYKENEAILSKVLPGLAMKAAQVFE